MQPNAPTSAPTNAQLLTEQVTNIQAQLANERKLRITTEVENLVRKIANSQPVKFQRLLARAIADETYLAELKERPQHLPGAAPLNYSGAPAIHTMTGSVRNALY